MLEGGQLMTKKAQEVFRSNLVMYKYKFRGRMVVGFWSLEVFE